MPAIAEDRGPGRPRSEDTRQAILQAAYELLHEGGVAAFSIEAVARRSGAAKTTIYRWWPNKGALAVESFLNVAERDSPFPEGESAIADLKDQLHRLARAFRGRLGRVAAGILAEAQTHPDVRKAFVEGYVRPRRADLRRLIERGVASGELRAGLDVDAVSDALYGPIYLRLLLRHAPLDDAFVEQTADAILRGLRPTT
jgi:AcrR family transcriptional regulator